MRTTYDEAGLLASKLTSWLANNSVACGWGTVSLSRVERAFAAIAYSLLVERNRAEKGKAI